VLDALQAGGYCCGYQITWGSWQGGWPQDWMQRPKLEGELPPGTSQRLLGQAGAAPAPAAAEALQGAGAAGRGAAEGGSPAAPVQFQVKVHLPADIEASVALLQEEEGFWGRSCSALLGAVFEAGGWGAASVAGAGSGPAAAGGGGGGGGAAVDEFFYQDAWSGPSALGDRLLLLLGDPLQQVEVPFTPQTLVQNWQLG
jgi:hypothetical protein